MPLELLPQEKVTLWQADAINDYGEPTLASPQEIQGRWGEDTEQNTNDDNNTIAYDVKLRGLSLSIPIQSIIWRGELSDLPGTPIGLFQVVDFRTIKDVKGRDSFKTAFLIKYGDTLPELT